MWGQVEEDKERITGDRKRLYFGDGHTMQNANDVLLSCTLETYVIL